MHLSDSFIVAGSNCNALLPLKALKINQIYQNDFAKTKRQYILCSNRAGKQEDINLYFSLILPLI